jgi:hypothetical protein
VKGAIFDWHEINLFVFPLFATLIGQITETNIIVNRNGPEGKLHQNVTIRLIARNKKTVF